MCAGGGEVAVGAESEREKGGKWRDDIETHGMMAGGKGAGGFPRNGRRFRWVFHARQAAATVKRPISNVRHTLAYCHVCQAATIPKCLAPDERHATGYRHIRQIDTPRKRIIPDTRHAVGNRHVCRSGAIGKCPASDVPHGMPPPENQEWPDIRLPDWHWLPRHKTQSLQSRQNTPTSRRLPLGCPPTPGRPKGPKQKRWKKGQMCGNGSWFRSFRVVASPILARTGAKRKAPFRPPRPWAHLYPVARQQPASWRRRARLRPRRKERGPMGPDGAVSKTGKSSWLARVLAKPRLRGCGADGAALSPYYPFSSRPISPPLRPLRPLRLPPIGSPGTARPTEREPQNMLPWCGKMAETCFHCVEIPESVAYLDTTSFSGCGRLWATWCRTLAIM